MLISLVPLVYIANLILNAILMFIFMILGTLFAPLYELGINKELEKIEIQNMIEKGYLDADYTKQDLNDFCVTYYNVLWQESLNNTCFRYL
jgi:hypothetical protein